MRFNSIQCTLACLGIAVLAAPAAFSQQMPTTSDQYQGVSQPPPDDTIVATPDTPPPTPKPSPRVYAPPPPPSAVSRPAAVSRTRSASDSPVITTGPSSNPPSRWDNTDYGIVTTPVPDGEDDPVPPDTAILHVRDSRSSGPSNALAVGTPIEVRIDQAFSTDTTLVGARFSGKVMLNVIQGGSIIIPSGSTLRGRVAQVNQGHRFGGTAVLRLRPETIILPDGTTYRLNADATSSEASGIRIGSEGAILPSSHLLKETAEYGIGVGTGAAVGAGMAGPAGALVGSVAGAGVVTTHILVQPPHAVNLRAGSAITFSLTQPLNLTPAGN